MLFSFLTTALVASHLSDRAKKQALEAKSRTFKPVILAGGLNADNVGEAIAKVRPYAVDVSSGVEAEPGRKDHRKLRDFFKAVQKADAKLK